MQLFLSLSLDKNLDKYSLDSLLHPHVHHGCRCWRSTIRITNSPSDGTIHILLFIQRNWHSFVHSEQMHQPDQEERWPVEHQPLCYAPPRKSVFAAAAPTIRLASHDRFRATTANDEGAVGRCSAPAGANSNTAHR